MSRIIHESGHQVSRFGIPADNVENLKNFYSSLFGSGISGALAQKENSQQVSTQFVNVESIEDYISKAKQLGVRVIRDKQKYQKDIMLY